MMDAKVIHEIPIYTTVESYRIFTKVLNILACKYRKRGTERGRLSRTFVLLKWQIGQQAQRFICL